MTRFILALTFTIVAAIAQAVEPEEVLNDPVLETRARSISKGLRCVVCQNESIDESESGIAKDMRLLVRDRLLKGDSDQEVIDYIVVRYGEFVLLQPNGRGANLVLWLAGPLMMLCVGIGVGLALRRPRKSDVAQLTEDEEKALRDVLQD